MDEMDILPIPLTPAQAEKAMREHQQATAMLTRQLLLIRSAWPPIWTPIPGSIQKRPPKYPPEVQTYLDWLTTQIAEDARARGLTQ